MNPLSLLNPSDPDPVRKTPALGEQSSFVLLGDHAGAAIPAALGDLGLAPADRGRHIALDLGAEATGRALSENLGSPFVWQAYSRLVIDCNRDPADARSIPCESDGTPIPANQRLFEAEREARRSEIFEPYQRAISDLLDRRERAGLETVLVSLHSFTPVMAGERRPWHVGVLHDGRRDDFALAVLALLREREELTIGDNQPYRMDETDYTVPRHAYPRSLRYLEIEVRQDLLAEQGAVQRMADLLSEVLPAAL
jgi:predicted N-formylglutamate amidohydrolase